MWFAYAPSQKSNENERMVELVLFAYKKVVVDHRLCSVYISWRVCS